MPINFREFIVEPILLKNTSVGLSANGTRDRTPEPTASRRLALSTTGVPHRDDLLKFRQITLAVSRNP
jgi:hypothetical protein